MLIKVLEIILNNRFLFTACSIFAALGGLFALTNQFHMLQQNSYFPSRYTAYLKENGKKQFVFRVALFLLLGILNIKTSGAALLLYTAVILCYMVYSIKNSISVQKKAIIKLAYTKRIKRMYLASGIFFALLTALQFFVAKGKYYWFLSLISLLAIIPQINTYFIWAVLHPMEKAITKHYIKDAKRILSSFGSRLKVIGVTGSYGKTGTKNILLKMLSEKYNTATTPRNFNTTMGVVRTIREHLRSETEVFICEMGAKNKGDIKEICDLVNPTAGIITSIGPQHLDTFGNIRTVVQTKFELYDKVNQNGGMLFANTDNKYIKERSLDANIIGYGTAANQRFYADEIEYSSIGETFTLHLDGESVRVRTKLLGAHNILNITGAAALAYSMGVTPKQIAFAVSRLEQTEHRLELKSYINGATLIDDAYNANPEGSIEACHVIGRFENKKKIIVTPGLVELGEKEYECNFNLGKAAAENADIIILVGKNRSKPLADGIATTAFNKDNLFIAESFIKAREIFTPLCDKDTVLLFENDLPDNYLN